MALIDGNTRKIEGTNIEINNIFIACLQPNPSVLNPSLMEITIAFQCYESAAKFASNPYGNYLRIEGLTNKSKKITYNRATDGDVFEFVDHKMKEYIIELFPESDPELITYIPPHAVA